MNKNYVIFILSLFTGLISGILTSYFLTDFEGQINEMIYPGFVFGITTTWLLYFHTGSIGSTSLWFLISLLVYFVNYWIGFVLIFSFAGGGGTGVIFILAVPAGLGAALMGFSAKKLLQLNSKDLSFFGGLVGVLATIIGLSFDISFKTQDYSYMFIFWQTAVAGLIGYNIWKFRSSRSPSPTLKA